MRLGEAAENLGVNPDTLVNWMDRFLQFFSPEALKIDGRLQREINDDDLVILNTIRSFRARKAEWATIGAALAAGERDKSLPTIQQFTQGKTPIQVYQSQIVIQQKLDQTVEELERTRQELVDERKEKGELLRLVGKLEGQLEIYKDMLKEK